MGILCWDMRRSNERPSIYSILWTQGFKCFENSLWCLPVKHTGASSQLRIWNYRHGNIIMPAPTAGALSDDAVWSLSVWRVSVAYIGPKPRTERPRKTKIDTEVAHVTRDSDTTFKVQRSKVKVIRPLWLAVLAGQHGHRVHKGSRCVYDVYRVTTCRPGRRHIVAASRLQVVAAWRPVLRASVSMAFSDNSVTFYATNSK